MGLAKGENGLLALKFTLVSFSPKVKGREVKEAGGD
jgi:hypothetical protein